MVISVAISDHSASHMLYVKDGCGAGLTHACERQLLCLGTRT